MPGASLKPTYPDLDLLPVVDVRRFGAKGDGLDASAAGNDAAFVAATAAAKVMGNTRTGARVLVPSGRFKVNNPVVLPRTGVTPTSVVHLVGETERTSVIEGTSVFLAGRSVVEYEAVTSQVWFGRIANLGITVPSVAGCRAIWFRQNQASILNTAQASAEWYQVHLENIEINCHNDYCQEMIRIDTGMRISNWKNIMGNPVRGNGTYATRLISTRARFDSGVTPGDEAGAYPGVTNDSLGFQQGTLENIWPMAITGGYCSTFKGRMVGTVWNASFNNGSHSKHLPNAGYHFLDSYSVTVNTIGGEGWANTHLRLEHSCGNTFNDCNWGTVRPLYPGWTATTVYQVGDRVVSTAMLNGNPVATANLYFFATVAGTSGGVEPTWPTVAGNILTDGGVSWQAAGPAVGNEVEVVDESHANRFNNRHNGNASGISSFRATRAILVDSTCKDNVWDNWTLRCAVNTGHSDGEVVALNEISFPSDDNRNHASGMAHAAFNDVRIPYHVGSHPLRPSRTAVLDFPSINAGASATLTITVPGAALLDDVRVTPPANLNAGLIHTAWVSAINTVTVRLFNATAGALDAPSGTWRAMVVKP